MHWQPVEGFLGRYAVSRDGEVLSMDYAGTGLPGLLKPGNARGYATVELYDGAGNMQKFTVHALVAAAFIGPRPVGAQINHRDGVKRNNAATNLEYCTPSENMKHAHAMGLQSNKGERHSQSKLKESDIMRIRELLALGFGQSEIAKNYGVTQSLICKINTGKQWAHVATASAVAGV